MTDLAINRQDGSNDIIITAGNLQLQQGIDFVAQRLFQRLDIRKGEWFLDASFGVPYNEQILVRNPNLSAISAVLRERILSTPEVTRVENFSLDFDNTTGLLSLDFEAKTPFGVIAAESQGEDIVGLMQLLLLTPLQGVM